MYRQLGFIFLSCFVFQSVSTATECELEHCPTFWTGFKDHCYRFFDKWATWMEANEYCRSYGSPKGLGVAYLLTLHSAEEEQFVVDFADHSFASRKHLWLGFTDIAKEGKFKWVDGKRPDYTNWRKNEPSNAGRGEDCASLLTKEKRWNDVPCNKKTVKRTFICKMRRA